MQNTEKTPQIFTSLIAEVEQESALPTTETPEFKSWFGDSKITDDKNRPLIVYHGTDADFTEFKYGEFGFHFGSTKEQAEDRGSKIGEYYLKLKNPLEFYDLGDWNDVGMWGEFLAPDNYEILTDKEVDKLETIEDVKQALIDKGYDGIIYENQFEGKGSSYIALAPNQIKSATHNLGTFSPDSPDIRYKINAYHGSPYEFNKFTTQQIGNGEGIQAQGWGMYFSSEKDIAEWYRKKLSPKNTEPPQFDGEKITGEYRRKMFERALALENKRDSDEYAEAVILSMYLVKNSSIDTIVKKIKQEMKQEQNEEKLDQKYYKNLLQWLETNKERINFPKAGHLYEVSLTPNNTDLLDWDKLLSEQSAKIEGIIKKTNMYDGEITGKQFYQQIVNQYSNPELSSRYLDSIGIPGIKYLDGNSRIQGEGNHNYVIFDDVNIEIQKKYQIALLTQEKALAPFTLETIQSAFPNQPILQKDNYFLVALPNHTTLRINPNWDIKIDHTAIKDLYPNGLPPEAKPIASYHNRTISLTNFASLTDLHHEIFHAAYAMTLNKTEIQTLQTQYGTGIRGEEKAAEAYEKWQKDNTHPERTTTIGKCFQKISDFTTRIRDTIIKDEQAIFRAIADGRIWQPKSPTIAETLTPFIKQPQKAFCHLVDLGNQIYNDGYKSPKQWLTRMHTCLKDTWQSYKEILPPTYTTVLHNQEKDLAVRYTFAGINAKTANILTLENAKLMESQGVPAETIRKQSGWNRSMDGKWRFEIDDSKLEFKNKFFNAQKMLETVAKEKYSTALKHIINHDELFSAYPQLKEVKVFANNMEFDSDVKGGINENGNIVLKSSLSPTEIKQVLTHEVQHLIQHYEHFGRGSTPEMFNPLDITDKEIQKINVEITEALAENPEFAKLYKENSILCKKYDEETITPKEEDRQMQIAEIMAENHSGIDLKMFNLESQIQRLKEDRKILSPYDQYENLAGEIEARNVSTRLHLTSVERRTTTPDLPANATVIFESSKAANQKEPRPDKEIYYNH